jgi:uncharacterized protein (UPF0332 family)
MPEFDDVFLEKAVSALAGAESELAEGRYDNVANRCYYACFQAAVVALEPTNRRHASAMDAFGGASAIRRGVNQPSEAISESPPRCFLSEVAAVRQTADYSRRRVSESEARQVLRRSREFVAAVRDG